MKMSHVAFLQILQVNVLIKNRLFFLKKKYKRICKIPFPKVPCSTRGGRFMAAWVKEEGKASENRY